MTLTSQVYDSLSEAILQGKYRPEEKLKAEHIKAQYGVSAATVREALNRLLADGLVVVHDRRGFSVAPFSLDDLADIIRARLLIEVECVRDAIENGDATWEANLVAAYHYLNKAEMSVNPEDQASLQELEVSNNRFHSCLVAGCTSPTLIDFYHKLFVRHYRYRRLGQQHKDILRHAKDDHKKLLDAALNRDSETAAKIIEEHVIRTKFYAEDLKKVFEANAAA